MSVSTMRVPLLGGLVALTGLFFSIAFGALGDEALTMLPLLFVGLLWLIPALGALSRGSTLALMIFVVLLVFLTDGNFRARDWSDKSLDWQVLLKAGMWFIAGLLGLMHWSRIWPMFTQAPVSFAWLFVLLLLASSLWSPNVAYASVSAAAFCCMLLCAMVVTTRLTTEQLIIALAIGFGLLVVPSGLMSPITKSFSGVSEGSTAEAHRLRGMVEHPIPMAEDAMIFVFLIGLLLVRYRRQAFWLGSLFLIGVWTVWETRSRIPVASMVAAVSFVWFYRKGGAWTVIPLAIGGVALLVMATAMTGIEALLPRPILEIVARGGGIQEVVTLSGRTTIWPYVMEMVRSNLLLGYGHSAGLEVFKGFTRWKIVHAHNAYLQTLLYTGMVGLTLLIAVVGYQIKVFLRKPDMFRDGLMIALLFKGVTEQSFMSNLPNTSTFLWMVTIVLAWQAVAEEQAARRTAVRRRRAEMEARARGEGPVIDLTPTEQPWPQSLTVSRPPGS